MKYKIIFLFVLFMLSACAAKPKIASQPPLPLMNAPEPITVQSSNPMEFEKSIPTSSILKKSLFVFENTYPRIYSDGDVLDSAAGGQMLAVLKAGSVGFSMPYCSSLVTGDGYRRVKTEGFSALIYGQSKIALFSAEECARFAVHYRLLRGEVSFIGGRLIEWEGSKAVLRDALSASVLYNGDTGLVIATAGVINGETVLVHSNGYITYYDVKAKAFAFKGSFPVQFDALNYSEGKFYGIKSVTKEFFVITEADSELTNDKNCILSASSPYALCEDKLVGFKKSYEGVPKMKYFTANTDFLADLNDGNLNIYSLFSSWQRFLRLDYELPAPCVDGKGNIYFTSFEGGVTRYSKGTESIVKERPEKCDAKSVTIKGGEFLCKGKKCGVFANKILESGADSMFRRIENGKRYYFFNDLTPVDKVD